MGEENALFREEVGVGLLGPGQQAAPAGEERAAGHRQRHGDEKAQGGAALTAVQMHRPAHAGGIRSAFFSQSGDGEGGAVQLRRRPQRPHTGQGGGDVLRHGHVGDDAGPPGQRRGDDEPVGLTFGGGRGDGPGQLRWRDGNIHGIPPRGNPAARAADKWLKFRRYRPNTASRFWSTASLGIFTGTAWPIFSRKIMVMSDPALFLSRPTARTTVSQPQSM